MADVEDEESREDHMIEEQMFTFDKFEAVRPTFPLFRSRMLDNFWSW